MIFFKNFLKTLILPLLFFACAHYLLNAKNLSSVSVESFHLVLIVLFLLVFVLAFILKRSRLFLALVFPLSFFLLYFFGVFSQNFLDTPFFLILVLITWGNFLFLDLSGNFGIISRAGKLRLTFIISQLVVLPLIIFPNLSFLEQVFSSLSDLLQPVFPFNLPLVFISLGFLLLCLRGFSRANSRSADLGAIFLFTFAPFLYQDLEYAWPVFYLALILFSIARLLFYLYTMAYRDELTGLPSRRTLQMDTLNLAEPYSIAMVDIDHFKRVNDRYGHMVGDQVLQYVASLLEKTSGPGKAYRFGGEEFALIFPGKNGDEAIPYLERLREIMAQQPFYLRKKIRPRRKSRKRRSAKNADRIKVTASIGLADNRSHSGPQEVIKAADRALYQAKNRGRDRIVKKP